VQISISTRHGQLNAETQERITEKMGKLPHIFNRVTGVQVTVDLEHQDSPHVEVTVTAEHTHEFVATERATTVMAAVDGVVHKLEQQLRKHKEKITDRRAVGAKNVETPAASEDLGRGESR
jgi:putative sigma-54 modulation protein